MYILYFSFFLYNVYIVFFNFLNVKFIAILTGKALREKNDDLLSDQQHLEKLMDSEWNDHISHHSLATFHGK